MNKKELTEKWNQVLELLCKSMEKLKVDNFFRQPLKPVKLIEKEGVILLQSASKYSFYQNMINRNKEAFDKAVTEVFGKNYIITVTDSDPGEDTEVEAEQLDPKYTFETFVAGNNSRLAYAASIAVAEGCDNKYNPLFLYGSSGLGKTHLMHAIGQYVKQNDPSKKVLYVSSETFTNELIVAIQNKTQQEFKKKYRSVDYLLFDDVQFIAGRLSTEEELFATFDALFSAKKQIVFTSDRPPKDLGDIPERLIGRFSWGLIADIQAPDYETRMAILKNKAILEDLDITDPDTNAALDTIANSITTNIRELESAFTRVLTFSTLTNEKMTSAFVKSVLSEVYNIKPTEITPEMIKKCVADHFGVKVSDLEGNKHSKNIAYPRQIAIYIIREKLGCSLPKIGELFGGRDHSTILYSYEKIKKAVKSSDELQKTIADIDKML